MLTCWPEQEPSQVGMQTSTIIIEIGTEIFKELKLEIPFHLPIPLHTLFLKELKTSYYSDTYMLVFA